MTPEREELERQLKAFEDAKKAAKGHDDKAFLQNARGIVAMIKAISRLSDDNQITDWQVSSYCWALYAVLSKSADALERRQMAVRLVCAYRRKIDSSRFWGDAKAAEFGKTLFNAIVLQLYKLVKETNEGAEAMLLKTLAKPYLEMLSLRAEAYLDDVAFRKEPVTEVQRKAMEAHAGKKIKMKEWPSLAEKAFGLMNRCIRAVWALKPSAELVAFLGRHRKCGEWLGFYYANAQVRLGNFAAARGEFSGLLRRKRNEAWAWEYLAEACQDFPEKVIGCLCRALQCPIRDPEIGLPMAIRIRRRLARVLASLGRNEEAKRELDLANRGTLPDVNDVSYRRESTMVTREILGDVELEGRCFSGHLVKCSDKGFGFVNDRKLGRVFIPPIFATEFKDGDFVRGTATLREDKKKNRQGYCMIR